jgi:hypothetical protein
VINGLGTWGLAITNNLTQGQGEVDFVSLFYPYGGFRWYATQNGYVKVDLMALFPNGTLTLWGLGIQYNGIPHGGNTIGFSWYNNLINAYVDGGFVGYLPNTDYLAQYYLQLIGGTLSGPLKIQGGSAAWGGFNYGQQLLVLANSANHPGIGISDYRNAYWVGISNNSGSMYFSGMPALNDSTTAPRIWLSLGDGGAQFSGGVTSGTSTSGQTFIAVNAAATTGPGFQFQSAGYSRWLFALDHYAESGGTTGNGGAGLALYTYNNDGSFHGTAFQITRDTWQAYFSGSAYFTGPNPQINIDGPVSTWRTLQFFTSGAPRWNVQASADAESGSDTGSNFSITRVSDTGAYSSVLSINRASGLATFNYGLQVVPGLTASQITGTQSGGGNSSAIRVVAGSNATYEWNETGAAADNRKWDAIAGGGSLYFRTLNDTESAANAWLTVNRSGATASLITFTGTLGPLHLGNRIAPNNNGWDTSAHITLWDGGYGFSITGGTLNIVSGQTIQFWSGGSSLGYLTGGGGLVLTTGSTVLLGRDPTAAMEAVTLQYLQGYAGAGGPFMPLSGGAMTGRITFEGPSNSPGWLVGRINGVDQWVISLALNQATPDFFIGKFVGSASYIPGIKIVYATMEIQLGNNLSPFGNVRSFGPVNIYPDSGSGVGASLTLQKPASPLGLANTITGMTGTSPRWQIRLGDSGAETSGNIGSDFGIVRYNNAGNQLGVPLNINRVSGDVTLAQALYVGGSVNVGTTLFANGNVQVAGSLNINSGRVLSYGTGNVAYAMWNTTAALGSALWLGNDGVMWLGIADSNGTPTGGQVSIDRSNNLSANGLYASYIQSNGSIMCNSGTFYIGANTGYGFKRDPGTGTWSWFEATSNINATLDATGVLTTRSNYVCQGALGIQFSHFTAQWLAWSVDTATAGCVWFYNGTYEGYLIKSQAGTPVVQIYLDSGPPQMIALYYPSNAALGWSMYWSDRRLKSDIKPSTIDALGIINRIPVHDLILTTPFKDAEPQHWPCSLIADELEPLIPLAYVKGKQVEGGGILHDRIGELPLICTMVRAMQQLTEQNAALMARIETLEARTLH